LLLVDHERSTTNLNDKYALPYRFKPYTTV
jgi:hypothetical protein